VYNAAVLQWPCVDLDDPPREHVLFVCTANVDRSRTAEDLYRNDPRYEVRSAGVAPFATVPVTRDLLLWADRVFVMSEREDQHRTLIRIRFPDVDRPTVDLDVSDRWPRGHAELVALLLRRLRPHLGLPRPPLP
jgi:protein-tyrosine phosphatase